MKVRAQIGMVLNLDKCIGCHTCSVTCKNVWTSRPGMEYAWFNNVETKPGMFDEYMAYLNGPYRALQEAGKKRGDILAYHVLQVDSPREHEPDVILLIEFKNMAVFDRSLNELDKDTSTAFGSVVKSNQAAVKREEIRVLRGGVTARELVMMGK